MTIRPGPFPGSTLATELENDQCLLVALYRMPGDDLLGVEGVYQQESGKRLHQTELFTGISRWPQSGVSLSKCLSRRANVPPGSPMLSATL